MKTNLFKRIRNTALSVALAATLALGLGNLHRTAGTATHSLAPHALLVDGVETHGGKKPPKTA